MKILQCHNFYQQPGGEDQVFADEASLLRAHGHEVLQFTRHNDDVDSMGRWQLARKTIWNDKTYHELRHLIRREQPDFVHCTNIFPLISPSAYAAARNEHVPVIQSLHNFRLLCPNALFLRDGQVCEKCLERLYAWPAVIHGCYRQNRRATAVVAAMQTFHRFRGTWKQDVDRYIALSEFSRHKFIEGGLPADRISVKPNFIDPDPGPGFGDGEYLLFVGRLSAEKGIETLLQAWKRLPEPFPLELKIVGDGPLAPLVADAALADSRVQWHGQLAIDEVLGLLGGADFLLLPSICYENCPKTLVESFARATPVVASRLGAMAEMVSDTQTGFHFNPGDPDDLVRTLQHVCTVRDRWPELRAAARAEYEAQFTAEANYQTLLAIYQQASRDAAAGQPTDRQDRHNANSQIPCGV